MVVWSYHIVIWKLLNFGKQKNVLNRYIYVKCYYYNLIEIFKISHFLDIWKKKKKKSHCLDGLNQWWMVLVDGLNQWCIGKLRTYCSGGGRGNLFYKDVEDLPLHSIELLKIRVSIDNIKNLSTIFIFQENKFWKEYHKGIHKCSNLLVFIQDLIISHK